MKTLILVLVFFSSEVFADHLLDGASGAPRELADVVQSLPPGSVIVVSEQHGFAPHHRHQVEFLKALSGRPGGISVGMEFFSFDKQPQVDQYLGGKISEAEFLKAVDWGQISFDFYREQTLFARETGGKTLALNSPRWLTGKISKAGLASLTEEERSLLPERLTLGNDLYRARFKEVMEGHVSEEALERYFEAQSVWDETMANTACRFQDGNPGSDLVIIVGDFHAAYGGGLPDRLRARGCENVYVISQVQSPEEAAPDSRWGIRADWVWISDQGGEDSGLMLE